jgi:hypothetical protein
LRYFLKYISVNKTFDIQNLNGIVVQSSENYDPFCPPAVSKTELKYNLHNAHFFTKVTTTKQNVTKSLTAWLLQFQTANHGILEAPTI